MSTAAPRLIGQLMADEKLSKEEAQRVSLLADYADAGRPAAAAARALGITVDHAVHLAARFKITFASGGPA